MDHNPVEIVAVKGSRYPPEAGIGDEPFRDLSEHELVAALITPVQSFRGELDRDFDLFIREIPG